jgi:hypothetical protein
MDPNHGDVKRKNRFPDSKGKVTTLDPPPAVTSFVTVAHWSVPNSPASCSNRKGSEFVRHVNKTSVVDRRMYNDGREMAGGRNTRSLSKLLINNSAGSEFAAARVSRTTISMEVRLAGCIRIDRIVAPCSPQGKRLRRARILG